MLVIQNNLHFSFSSLVVFIPVRLTQISTALLHFISRYFDTEFSRNTVQNASVKIRHVNVILMKLLQIDEGVLWVADGTPGNTPADLSRRQGDVKFRVSVEIALLEGVCRRSGE